MTNHLGNVLVTVTDRKHQVPKNDSVINYFEPDVATANDYYPGGMDIPGRSFSATNQYRYGFNGKEKDNKTEVVQYDYGCRIYDPRLVRFKSVDPLTKSFPWNSPYSFAEGDMIRSIDLDGLEKYVVTYWYDDKGNHRKTTVKAIRAGDSKEIMDLNFSSANGGDLTNKDVWVRKLYLDGRQKEPASGKSTLNTSEKEVFGKAKTIRESNPKENTQIYYDLGDEKGGANTQSEDFSSTDFEFREATKTIPLIKDLHSNFNSDGFYTSPMDGTGQLEDDGAKKLSDFSALIKEDGGIKSINVTLTQYLSPQLSEEQAQGMKNSLTTVANQMKKVLEKSGVKIINVNVDAGMNSNFKELNNNVPDIQITLKR